MKRRIGLSVILLLLLNMCSVFAREATSSWEITSSIQVVYECSFDAELDRTFRNTWLYALSNNGVVHMTFQRVDMVGGPNINNYLLKVGGKQYLADNGRQEFGSKGIYDFRDLSYEVSGNAIKSYSGAEDLPYLRLMLEKNDGENEIKFWMHNCEWVEGKGIVPSSSVITVDNAAVKESREGAQYVFNINGEYKENIAGSTEDDRKTETEKNETNIGSEKEDNKDGQKDNIGTEDKNIKEDNKDKKDNQLDNIPVDYSDLSQDPRRFDDKEKAIAAYGKYKDENGVMRAVGILYGTWRGANYDYNTDITAEFDVQLGSTGLSSTGDIHVTYYHLERYFNEIDYDGKRNYRDGHIVRFSGDLGEQWFVGGTMEVNKPDSSVEFDPSSRLEDDRSVVVGFIPVEQFDGKTYEHEIGINEELWLTFRFKDNTRTALDTININYTGKKDEVFISEVNYSGELLLYLLGYIYPENYMEIGKEMGIVQ